MRITPEMEAEFERNRLRMEKVEHGLRKYMWAMIILGAGVFSMSFFAGALSTLTADQSGPAIFYYAMSAGVFQILIGLLSIVLGWMTASKKRTPCTILLVIYGLSAIIILMQKNGTFNAANLIFLAAGIALNIWAQSMLNENTELSQLQGYPHFVPQATFRAKYEESADVLARRAAASTHMESLGTPAMPFPPTANDVYMKPVKAAAAPQPTALPTLPTLSEFQPTVSPAPQPMQPVSAPAPAVFQPVTAVQSSANPFDLQPQSAAEEEEDSVFSHAPKPLGPTPSVRLPQQVNLFDPHDLENLNAVPTITPAAPQPAPQLQPMPQPIPQVKQPAPKKPQPMQPVSAPAPAKPAQKPLPETLTLENLDAYIAAQKEAALPKVNAADMLVDMTAIPSHAVSQGNPDMLPTPEEVRARMAAMKRAREEHPRVE